jgi:uncharacterized protein (DUF2267 family)
MPAGHIDAIDHTIQTTNIWLNEIDAAIGWDHRQRSYRLLRAVLHALRDQMQVNEAADLGAQLPLLIRGIYYESWRPAATPVKRRSLGEFLAAIDKQFTADPIADTQSAVRAVFALLAAKISAGEIGDVRHALPKPIRDLWPE